MKLDIHQGEIFHETTIIVIDEFRCIYRITQMHGNTIYVVSHNDTHHRYHRSNTVQA